MNDKNGIITVIDKLEETALALIDSIKRIFLRWNTLFFVFYVFVAYSFSLFNRTISVDDLARRLYIGEGKGMIRAFRWMFWVFNRVFSTQEFSPFIDDFISLLFMIASALVICCIFDYIKPEERNWKYIIFTSIYVTFPLINEIWEYTGSCLAIYGGIFFSSVAVMYFLKNEDDLGCLDYTLMGIFLIPSMASYEAGVFAYITLVFAVLFIRYLFNVNTRWFFTGIKLAIPLVVALVGRIVIGYLLIICYGVKYQSNGDTGIRWLKNGYEFSINEIIHVNKEMYFNRFSDYLPIFEIFAFLLVYTFINIKYVFDKKMNMLLAVLLPLSLFFQSLLQGYHLPYRTAQTMQIFVPFVTYLIVDLANKSEKVYTVIICVLMFVGYKQSVALYDYLALNNQRSDNEAMTINMIGHRLYSEYDLSKPVIFCGHYDVGDLIKRQSKKKFETDVQSVINWSMVAYDNQDMMKELFLYYGYEINVVDYEIIVDEYTKKAKDIGMKPLEIRDFNDYILVYFG